MIYINNIMNEENINFEDYIYEIRGQHVMIDSDLARFYKCKNGTKSINLAVKRHINRFPEEFMFQITNDEYNSLRFQFETLKRGRGEHKKYLPYAFTEEGVAMLSAVLRTEVAEEVSVKIIKSFIAMKKFITTGLIEQKYINGSVLKDNKRIDNIESYLLNFKERPNKIFYDGDRYDAYSFLLDIFNKSKEEIIIIDNYIDKTLLDILKDTNKEITIITNKYNNTDYKKYKEQYNNVNLKINNTIHDRFIIIDKSTLYHCGASFKDLGNKLFVISKIEDKDIINSLLKKI